MRYAGSFAFGNLCFGEFHSRAFRFAGGFTNFCAVWFGLVGRAYWRLHGPMEVNTAERAVQDNADSEPN